MRHHYQGIEKMKMRVQKELATKVNHLPCANTMIKTMQVLSLRTFSAASEC